MHIITNLRYLTLRMGYCLKWKTSLWFVLSYFMNACLLPTQKTDIWTAQLPYLCKTLTSQPACRLILYYSCLFVRVKIFSRGNMDAFSHILKRCFLCAGIPRSWWKTSTSWTAQGKWRRCDFKTSWCSSGSAQITHTSLTERNQVMSDDKRCQWDRTADG